MVSARGQQPPVVAVPVRQQHTEQRRIRLTQARHLGEQCARVDAVRHIERQAEIDDQPCPLRFDLHTGTADLSRTAQDS